MPNKKNNTRGFTMVELLLYMALLIIFTGVLTEIFVSIMKSRIRSESLSINDQDSRFITQRMFYDFNNSDDIDTTMAQYSIDADGTIYLQGDKLSSSGTKIENFSLVKIGNSVQLKFSIDNKNFQTTFNQR